MNFRSPAHIAAVVVGIFLLVGTAGHHIFVQQKEIIEQLSQRQIDSIMRSLASNSKHYITSFDWSQLEMTKAIALEHPEVLEVWIEDQISNQVFGQKVTALEEGQQHFSSLILSDGGQVGVAHAVIDRRDYLYVVRTLHLFTAAGTLAVSLFFIALILLWRRKHNAAEEKIELHQQAQMEAEKKVAKQTAELVAASKAKDEFLASMSHELRTPLTAIIGNCTLLANQEEDKSRGELIKNIEIAGQIQLSLVNDILDMSKLESGKFTIETRPYSLNKMLKDIENVLELRAQDARVALSVELKSEEPYLLIGDVQRVGQVLNNLLDNAIKFTEAGGRVSLTIEQNRSQLSFTVEDNGLGMSPETVSRLFSRFEQADSSINRRFGGTGLGLYISSNLAQLMGGEIQVSSEEGVGSSFVLRLPYQRSDEVDGWEEGRASGAPLFAEKLEGHVLIAEDTPMLQQLEKAMLEGLGLTVTIANDGQEAIDLAASNHYDIILMDMQMPIVDGVEATRQIKGSGNRTPIIALTANAMNKHRMQFQAAGCDRFLCKPIDLDELAKELRHYLSLDKPVEEENLFFKDPIEASFEASAGGDQLLGAVDELMSMFIETVGADRDKLVAALQAEEWDETKSVGHQIKGYGTTFGYPHITEVATRLCDAYDSGALEKLPRYAADLIGEIDAALHPE